MPQNDFLPFATNAAANVITQADYVASGFVANGFVDGIAQADEANKVWRQASFMVSSLGDFVMGQLNQDVPDDANKARMVAQIISAIQNVANNQITAAGFLTDSPHDGNTYGRQNGAWVPVSTGTGGTSYLPLTGGTLYQAATSDLLTISVDAGRNARTLYAVGGQRSWGVGNMAGSYTVRDELAGQTRLTIDGTGLTTLVNLTSPNATLGHLTAYLAAASDPVQITADAGRTARLGYTVTGARTWHQGVGTDGTFGLYDDGATALRTQVALDGTFTIYQRLQVNGAGGITGLLTLGNDLLLNRTDQATSYISRPNIAGFRNAGFGLAGGGNLDGVFIYANATQCYGTLSTSGALTVTGNASVSGQTTTGSLVSNGAATIYGVLNGNSNGIFAGIVEASRNLGAVSTSGYTGAVFSSNNSRGVGFWSNNGIMQFGTVDISGNALSDWMDLDTNYGLILRMGVGYQTGGGPWAAISDERLKKNVEEYRGGLAELRQLRPVTYQYNGLAGLPDDGRVFHGLLAQEAQEVMPELVGTLPLRMHPDDDAETELQTLHGNALTYALINAVVELAARLEALEGH